MRRKSCKLQGFILWQVVLGILMLVILMAACIVNVPSFLTLGRHDKALNDTAALCGLISQYEMEVGSYPSDLSELTQKKGQYGPWLKELPNDPYAAKNSNYQYQYQDDGFVVFSVGEDGASTSSVTGGIQGDDVGYISH